MQPQGHRSFLSQFTRLEQHFLHLVGERLHAEGEARLALRVLFRSQTSPEIELLASLGCHSQRVSVQVHGVRPVRYHIRTANTPLGRKLRRCLSQALGEENLHLAASAQSGPEISLLYHVHYPEDVLRQLG